MQEKRYAERPESREFGDGSERMDRSVADLLKGIVENVQEIIRSEVKLARAEIREEASKAGTAGRSFGFAAVLGLYAGGFVLFTIYMVLSLFLASWMAALAVAVVTGMAAAVMYASGKKMWKQVSAKPEKTIESVKENVAWLKNQTR
jgi:Flp pilus assembly protein TadB